MTHTKYWLMKSEPDVFSIDDLKKDKTTWWEGVRNYQARNFMMRDMNIGDIVLFYHSNATPSGIAGIARVTHQAMPDQSQFDNKSPYFDSRATLEKPVWFCVQLGFVQKFRSVISLDQLRQTPSLTDLLVLKKGQRLSVQPVSANHFEIIKKFDLGEKLL